VQVRVAWQRAGNAVAVAWRWEGQGWGEAAVVGKGKRVSKGAVARWHGRGTCFIVWQNVYVLLKVSV